MEEKEPEILISLLSGDFAYSSRNTISFTSIGLDQAQKRKIKGDGGISRITTKPITLLEYCQAAPELAQISEETDTMIGNTATSSKKHHQFNTSDETRQDNNAEKLKKELND